MHHADIYLKNNKVIVSGSLHFANVMSIYKKSLSLLANVPEYHFDLSGLTSSDSSGLALILEWLASAKKNQKSVKLYAVPQYLLSIAKAARMDEMISAVSI